jgi:hypothetical protein
MLPLAFVIICCVAFTILGLVVLTLLPVFRLTFVNLVLFVLGAVPGGIAFLFLYGKLFARDQLSDKAFYGIFPILLLGGVSGGTLAVWSKMNFAKAQSMRKSR